MARQKEPTWVTENKPFPKALKKLMNETNTTQPMLADSIGVTRQTISLYCTGQSTPDIEVFVKIAEYFNVSFDYLLGKSEAKERKNVDIQKETGLSEKAIKKLRIFNNRNSDFDENLKFNANFEFNKALEFKVMEYINSLLEHNNLKEFILKIHEAKKYSEFQIPDDVTGKYVMVADDAVAKFGGKVIGQKEAVEFYRQEAINIIRDVLCDLIPKMQED